MRCTPKRRDCPIFVFTKKWLGELAGKAYAAVDHHACKRLRRWLCTKHKVRGSGTARFPDQYLHEKLGLVQLSVRTRNFPWATA